MKEILLCPLFGVSFIRGSTVVCFCVTVALNRLICAIISFSSYCLLFFALFLILKKLFIL